MSSNAPVIVVRNLTKQFKIYNRARSRILDLLLPFRKPAPKFTALNDISFSCIRGETVGVIGKNGSGKSTLLQLLCGTLTPSSGEIFVKGKIAALLELGAGFNAEFTGRENVFIYGALYGLSQSEIKNRFAQIEAFAGLGAHIDQPVKTYSSGMYVRLAFSVIAHVDADILVIDEALAVGDAFFNQKCMRFLKEFLQTGTIFFVSHDLASVTSLCQRVLWLENGHLKADSDPKTVTQAYMASLFDTPEDQARPTLAPEFGRLGAEIKTVSLMNRQGQPLDWIRGGEEVVVSIACRLVSNLNSVIVGFLIKDKMGRAIFGANSSQRYPDLSGHLNDTMTMALNFRMPILAEGEYVVAAAIAEGTQADHVHHHWVHDALLFYAKPSEPCLGVIGVDAEKLTVEVIATSL